MKGHLGLSGIIGGGSVILLAAQPVWAEATRVTGVQVNQAEGGIEVVLATRGGDRPQIFTVARGNALTADITNAQLDLEQGNGFLQNNPVDGIASVTVTPLDSNSIRVTVTGESAAPMARSSQGRRDITLTYSVVEGDASSATAPSEDAVAQAPDSNGSTVPAPEVMIPDPQVSIDGVPARPSTSATTEPVAPVLPRAIAPPLGDIAVSTANPSPSEINLGTGETVPRLVLRDAPVRDVLSLLARAAGLNVAYIGEQGEGADAAATDPTAATVGQDVRISLDIENEPIQNVFNYVLRVADLEANRVGRTVFVGPRLPDTARNIVMRTLRMNQSTAGAAASYLSAQGAETQRVVETTNRTVEGEGANQVVTTETQTQIIPLAATAGNGPLLLRGLSVLTDERLNAVTLVGNPRQIEIASSMLSQLDLRQRQVAVNVKIVDVNLLNTEDFSTSFSFGWDDGFFSSDGGAATFNYGSARPPSAGDVRGSRLNPPITGSPFPAGVDDLEPFFDAQPNAPFGVGDPQPFGNPALNDGTIQSPQSTFFRPPFGTNSNPLQGGVTEINPDGTIEVSLPQLFQFPTDFLGALQAQIISGNAKILTDPTLVIQEGQNAQVVLGQDVVTNFEVTREIGDGGTVTTIEPQITPAGLTLELAIERIDDNGFVTLQVNPSVTVPTEEFQVEGLTGDDGATNTIILLARRDLQSGRIRIRDNQTLILSGIIQETDRTTVSKVPILGDIPILGALFRSTNRENRRQEVIVLLTPRILDDSDASTFGYRYTPGEETQEILQQQGVQLP